MKPGMTEPLQVDVLIVGGGHAGLLLGTALARAGISLRLIERQAQAAIATAPADGRTLALLAGSVAVVRRLGAWPSLAARTAAIEQVEVVDVAGGAHVHYDSDSHGQGPFGVGVEQVGLRQGLLEAFLAAAGPVALRQGEVAGLRRQGRRCLVDLADGSTIAAALVVGADGRGSRVRELARIGLDRWAYDQRALTLVLRHDRPHDGMVREWLRHGGPLATLPLPGRRTGVTWVERTAEAQRLAGLPHAELLGEFDALTGGVLGRVALESGPASYPLGAQHARALRGAALGAGRRCGAWGPSNPRAGLQHGRGGCRRAGGLAAVGQCARPRSWLRRGAAALRARPARRQYATAVADRRSGAGVHG